MTLGSGARVDATQRSMLGALALAIGAALLAALAWGLLRGILELGVGLVAVAALGGWGVGAAIRSANGSQFMAGAVAVAAWLLGLVATWLVSMAILHGSTRTFLERIEATPFTDWISPQFGVLEVAGLIVYVGAAAYASRPSSRRSRP
jgi:hypothetical protein